MTAPRRIRVFACLALLSVASAAIAFYRSFSRMVPYDDEGTMMLGLDRFFKGQVLYDTVRSIYGPVFYLYETVAHRLAGSPVSHDVVRWASVGWWITASAVLFLLVWRATDSLPLAALAQYFGFRNLGFIGLETAHPQEACITLLLAVALVAAWPRSAALRWFLIGALAGAIALAKINLAIFVLAAVGVVFTFALPDSSFTRVLRLAASLAGLALGPLLMAANLGQPWAQRFSAMIVLSLAASLAACSRLRIEPAASWRDPLYCAAGFLASMVAICAFPLAHGSTLNGMWYSMVVYPGTHFALTFSNPLQVHNLPLLWTATNLVLALTWWRRGLPDWSIAALKLTFTALVLVLSLLYGLHDLLSLGAPMLWLAAVPAPAAAHHRHSLLRPLLAIMGVLQILYAYPVAGAQGQFATLLYVAIAALDLHDTLPWLAARLPLPVPGALAAAAVALLLTALFAHDLLSARAKYRSFEALDLPGAHRLHIEPERAAALRKIVDAAHSCTMLVSQPGIYSLNLLSRIPVPPSLTAGAWMLFYNDDQQRVTVAELEREPRPCAVVDPEVVKFWAGDRDLSRQPLIRYIQDQLRPAFQAGEYEFRTR